MSFCDFIFTFICLLLFIDLDRIQNKSTLGVVFQKLNEYRSILSRSCILYYYFMWPTVFLFSLQIIRSPRLKHAQYATAAKPVSDCGSSSLLWCESWGMGLSCVKECEEIIMRRTLRERKRQWALINGGRDTPKVSHSALHNGHLSEAEPAVEY